MFELHKVLSLLVQYCFNNSERLGSDEIDLLLELEALLKKYDAIIRQKG